MSQIKAENLLIVLVYTIFRCILLKICRMKHNSFKESNI